MHALFRSALLTLTGLAVGGALGIAGCSGDPFDPLLGPRRPQEGAERYLTTRPDIPDIEKYRLLHHKPMDTAWLVDLARSPSRETRTYVAMNPATPPQVLAALAQDPDVGVRQYVTRHPALPRASARQLLDDPSAQVRKDALAAPVWGPQELWALYRQGRSGHDIAANKNTPADLLLTIARANRDDLPVFGLAGSPNISPEIETMLLNSRSADIVKSSLAANPQVSCATLRGLLRDPEPAIGRIAERTLAQRQQAGRGC